MLLANPQKERLQTGPTLWQQQQTVHRLDSEFTIAVVGEPGTGKSALIASICDDKERNVGGPDYVEKNANNSCVIYVGAKHVKYNLLEIDGDLKRLKRTYFLHDNPKENKKRKLDAIMILFNVTSRASMEAACKWIYPLMHLNLGVIATNYIMMGTFGDQNAKRLLAQPDLHRLTTQQLPAPIHYYEISSVQDRVEIYSNASCILAPPTTSSNKEKRFESTRESVDGFFGRLSVTIRSNWQTHEINLAVAEVAKLIESGEQVHSLLVSKLEQGAELQLTRDKCLFCLGTIEVHQPSENESYRHLMACIRLQPLMAQKFFPRVSGLADKRAFHRLCQTLAERNNDVLLRLLESNGPHGVSDYLWEKARLFTCAVGYFGNRLTVECKRHKEEGSRSAFANFFSVIVASMSHSEHHHSSSDRESPPEPQSHSDSLRTHSDCPFWLPHEMAHQILKWWLQFSFKVPAEKSSL